DRCGLRRDPCFRPRPNRRKRHAFQATGFLRGLPRRLSVARSDRPGDRRAGADRNLRSFGRDVQGVWRSVLERRLRDLEIRKVNLCCGSQKVPGYFGIDLVDGVDLRLDLAKVDLPFAASSLETVVCISAINYFT